MAQRVATASQSATSVAEWNTSRLTTNTIGKAFKRQRTNEDQTTENVATTTPRILVNDTPRTSEATDTLLPTTPTVYSEHNEYLATKLDLLHDKKERYTSHQEFLNRCLENDIVPIGLQLEL